MSESESTSSPVAPAARPRKRPWLWVVVGIVILVAIIIAIPWIVESFSTVSTEDAYVNGHVTFVAPRVPGQIMRVLVDDNNRVHKGDLLVAARQGALSGRTSTSPRPRLMQPGPNSLRRRRRCAPFKGRRGACDIALEHAIEDVDNQIALLRSKAATLKSQQATLVKSQADYERAAPLVASGSVTQEELDRRKQLMLVAQAEVEEALQGVYQVRVALGLPPKPENDRRSHGRPSGSGSDFFDRPTGAIRAVSSRRPARGRADGE